jgi:hypothetical protein
VKVGAYACSIPGCLIQINNGPAVRLKILSASKFFRRNSMADNWDLDVKKYVPDADPKAIAGIVRHCGIALQSMDSSLVAFTDKAEVGRVRDSFLKGKLGLTNPDTELDAAIAAVGDRMKGDRTRNRVTVYYLLADRFGKLPTFSRAGPPA